MKRFALASDSSFAWIVVVSALAVVLGCGGGKPPAPPASTAGFDPAGSDPEAIEIAKRAMEAMGGPEGWAATRYLAFDFVVEVGGAPPVAFRHYWDISTGRYRVEGMDEEQHPYLVLFNVGSRTGMAWIDGQRARNEEHELLMQEAYERFINDAYWLLMPLKLLDPGVHLHYQGEVREGSHVRDRIRVTFDPGTGLTPGDVYWAEVDRESGRMERWEFVLEGDNERYSYAWTDWREFGPLTLSTVKTEEGGPERIIFLNVIASEQVDPAPFEPPAEPASAAAI